MYMSRITLDSGRRETMRALQEAQLLHGAVESAFPGVKERRLWRIDWVGNACHVLIVSREQPDLLKIQRQFGFPGPEHSGTVKDYRLFLESLENGQTLRFRLKANPVVSVPAKGPDSSVRGRIHAHVTQEQQKNWLAERAQNHGFSVQTDSFDVTHTAWLRFEKNGGRTVTLRVATFEGFLKVEHAERLREALTVGIGRGKAYGCGLLTLAKAK